MNALLGIPSIDRPCNEVLEDLQQALVPAGLHTQVTFDLQAARVRATDCVCPRHGLARCDCQMVVLLIYGRSRSPVSLILHGSDEQTWLSVPDDVGRPADPLIVAAVEQGIRSMLSTKGDR